MNDHQLSSPRSSLGPLKGAAPGEMVCTRERGTVFTEAVHRASDGLGLRLRHRFPVERPIDNRVAPGVGARGGFLEAWEFLAGHFRVSPTQSEGENILFTTTSMKSTFCQYFAQVCSCPGPLKKLRIQSILTSKTW